jgi:hypothetical protein
LVSVFITSNFTVIYIQHFDALQLNEVHEYVPHCAMDVIHRFPCHSSQVRFLVPTMCPVSDLLLLHVSIYDQTLHYSFHLLLNSISRSVSHPIAIRDGYIHKDRIPCLQSGCQRIGSCWLVVLHVGKSLTSQSRTSPTTLSMKYERAVPGQTPPPITLSLLPILLFCC